MGMTIDEAIKRYESNAEYERTHGNLQGCLEFRQLVEWLRKYQKITEIVEHYRENVRDKVTNENMEKILKVVEDENFMD